MRTRPGQPRLPRLLLALPAVALPLLAGCQQTTAHGAGDGAQRTDLDARGTLTGGAGLEGSVLGGGARSARLVDDDLLLRDGGAVAIVRDLGRELEVETRGGATTFRSPRGAAVWSGPGLRVGGASFELRPGGWVEVDADGAVLVEQAPHVHFDTGTIARDVTTDSAAAQCWWSRGYALCVGFNHEEGLACFERALELDPGCAMAHWGVAYALGPNYNLPVIDPAAGARAHAACVAALAALDDETPTERALVEAMATRFAAAEPADRSGLDRAYAEAMRSVRRAHPDDADVCMLTAEALMQLRPWGLWSPEGEPALETPEIRAVLEAGLARWPDHAGLCHLYVHAMEAGPEVELSIPAAERLEGLAPGLGHLVHMPSHTYVWTGRYDDVVRVNLAACAVDDAYVAARGRENLYTAYRIHNFHFVAYGAMWDGRRDLALEYARAIPGEVPATLLEAIPDLFEVFLATPYHVLVRFGMWEEILEEPDPGAELPATRSVWTYARAVALASLGRVEEAEVEQARFEERRAAVPATRMLFQNRVADVLSVASAFLEGEIEYRKGDHERAFAELRRAVELDERLNYDEPWGWMEPVRHALGALLTEQGRYQEAIEVYEANLARYPENGWALHGLAECYRALGRTADAQDAEARFERAFARADVTIPGSCFCKGL